MVPASSSSDTRKLAMLVLWTAIIGASAWYLVSALSYAVSRDPQPGATLLNRQLWYFGHILFAVPLLFIGPLQFSSRLRARNPVLHRRLGTIFLVGSIVGGLLACYIGATISSRGSRIPLAMFGLVWAGFGMAAWSTARRKAFVQHRKFVIRTYALALAFVWVRLLETFEDDLYGFAGSADVISTTTEWLSLALPVLVVESVITWWPEYRAGRSNRAGGQS